MEDGKAGLTPKMQTAYDSWLAEPQRTIVLDKQRQAQVVNLAAKPLSKLKKHCLMLVLHMSKDPEELRIRSGSGQLWKLQLLRGSAPSSSEVPKDLDRFEGADDTLCIVTCMYWVCCTSNGFACYSTVP